MFNKCCYFCSKKENGMSNYISNDGSKIKVCYTCQPYAERRMFVKFRNSNMKFSSKSKVKFPPALTLIVVLLIIAFISTYMGGWTD